MPLPLLDGALRKTSWLADRAFGVVTTRLGLAVRVATPDLEEVVRLVQPENYNKFLGELWDVSGLPPSWGPDAVTDFLAGWKVSPLKTFRQGYRRTWVVRAMEQPMSTKLQHDFGPGSDQAFCDALPSRRKLEGMQFSHGPGQQWSQRQHHKKLRRRNRSTKTLRTSQPSKTVNLNTAPTAMDFGEIGQL